MEDYDALVGNSKNMIDVEDDDLEDVGWHRGVSKAVQLLLSDEAEEARVSDILLLPIHSASGLLADFRLRASSIASLLAPAVK